MDQGNLETRKEINKKRKESISIKDEIILMMQTKGETVQFKGQEIKLEWKILDKGIQTTMETSIWILQKRYRGKMIRAVQQKGNAKLNIQKTRQELQ